MLRRPPYALVSRQAHPQRTLVRLELASTDAAAHGDRVHVGRSQVGVITGTTRSPVLRKNIALRPIAVQHPDVGTEVEVGKLDAASKAHPDAGRAIPVLRTRKVPPRYVTTTARHTAALTCPAGGFPVLTNVDSSGYGIVPRQYYRQYERPCGD